MFNLTVHIELLDDSYYRACIGGHQSNIAVSYGGALLAEAEGPLLPELCVGPRQGRGANITARGVDVAEPRFVRDRLAAELERSDAAGRAISRAELRQMPFLSSQVGPVLGHIQKSVPN